jgi:hypothetical protein
MYLKNNNDATKQIKNTSFISKTYHILREWMKCQDLELIDENR